MAAAMLLLAAYATQPEDKQSRLYQTGHNVWMSSEAQSDELAFLDKYLGPTTQVK